MQKLEIGAIVDLPVFYQVLSSQNGEVWQYVINGRWCFQNLVWIFNMFNAKQLVVVSFIMLFSPLYIWGRLISILMSISFRWVGSTNVFQLDPLKILYKSPVNGLKLNHQPANNWERFFVDQRTHNWPLVAMLNFLDLRPPYSWSKMNQANN